MTDQQTARSQLVLEAIEATTLAPYAQRSAGAPRRYQLGDQARTLIYRTQFQRDRDRILHSHAFRRLKHKTQVYVASEGDHHRTRLTHTLEVAQVARTIARALGLNEDLVEAIALGHDLGQPPFGGGGNELFAAVLAGEEKVPFVTAQVLRKTGGFRPNYQSLRIVDRLEQRYDHPGINLSDPVREGIWKAGGPDPAIHYPDLNETGLYPDTPPSLEAQVVAVADLLARLSHDLEDGIRSGEVAITELERSGIGRTVARARTFLTGLFAAYYQDPLQLDDYALLRYRAETGGTFLRDVPEERVDAEIEQRYQDRPGFLRIIADHIAGMSDTYALKEYERLYLPFPNADRRL